MSPWLLQAAATSAPGFAWPDTAFLWGALVLAAGLLVWDTVEVGRNDAANLVNAAYGARILTRERAVVLAGLGALLGATFSSAVMETARQGIFDPGAIPARFSDPAQALQAALAIYIGVYLVDTVLLYGYSAFGMPVSTTACLVFELLGAATAVGSPTIVRWPEAGTVILAILCSILASAAAAFIAQRAIRGAIGDGGQRLATLLLHGGWVGGAMLAGLTYFMLIKGMKAVPFVKTLNKEVIAVYGAGVVVLALWVAFAVTIHACLVIWRKRAARWLFPVIAMIATVAMAFAFGQNDLANCASPGLAALYLIDGRAAGVAAATKVPIATWFLFGSGCLLVLGMATQNAQRVTRAEAATGSMSNTVALYSPAWCTTLARRILAWRRVEPTLAPPPIAEESGETRDYDAVRACVILCVGASVIAAASNLGLPVSTTYVAFAAVVATGAADRILSRGDAELKLGRTIWVVFSWFSSALIAAVAAAAVALSLFHGGVAGMGIGLVANLAVRTVMKRRGDAQQRRVEEAARERQFPEEFAEFED